MPSILQWTCLYLIFYQDLTYSSIYISFSATSLDFKLTGRVASLFITAKCYRWPL